MITTWINGLNEEEQKVIRQEYVAAALLRRRLTAMLTNKIDLNRTSSRSKDGYQDPSWAYRQADAIGYERALSEIISLLSSKKDEK